MNGSSNQFVVNPAGFTLSNIQQTAAPNLGNPGVADATGASFVKAGEAFSVTVTGRNSAGSATPNYGQETTPETVRLTGNLVSGSGLTNNPAITNPTALGSFSAGVATGTTLSWTEVGIIRLTPSVGDGDYLGAGNITGTTSGNVGRFYPDHFAVIRNTPLFNPACSNIFTYVGHPFNYSLAPVLAVTARNSSGITTQNYAGTFMKITNTTITPNSTLPRYSRFDALGGGNTPALDVSSLPLATVDPAIGTFINGVDNLTFSGGAVGAVFTRSLQVAPFDADIALSFSLADGDGIVVARIDGSAGVNPVLFGTATAGNGIGFVVGATAKQMRFGRLTLGNAFGSELLDLPIPMETQYYNSSGVYVTNVDDSCTSIVLNNVFLSSGTVTGGGAFVSGKGTLKITKPLSKVSIDLCIDLDGSTPTDNSCIASVPANKNYFQWKWSGLAFDKDPKARATFGVFKNADEFIYLRENF